jgi:uncharacterized membrane protein
MTVHRPADPGLDVAAPGPRPAPTTTGEYITLLAHFHRAEIARMAGWRDRIDRTSHWAITAVGAMLSLSFSAPSAHHGIVLIAMVIVTLLLVIEARRYRFFDVFRARVRTLERNWFSPIFAAEMTLDDGWLRLLAEDLRHPVFLISLQQALARRIRRNYGWMYLILLFAWLLKTTAGNPAQAGYSYMVGSFAQWSANARLGPIPGLAVIAAVAAFYGWLLYLIARKFTPRGELAHGEVHV